MRRTLNFTFLGCRATFFGIAQIMLQQSAVVGVVFIVAAILNSPALACLGLVGSTTGALVAWFAGFDDRSNKDGLFGFNGALVGFGLGYFYSPQWPLLFIVVVGAAVSTLLMQFMLAKGIRPFTSPFVFTTWAIMFLFSTTGWFNIVPWPTAQSDVFHFVYSVSRGFGQVLFQEHFATGLLLILAVLFKSWIEGVYAIGASVFSVGVALVLGFETEAINLGLFGYNSVLCAIALAGSTRRDFVNATCAALLSIFLVWSVIGFGFPALTAPFVVATWIVLGVRMVQGKRRSPT